MIVSAALQEDVQVIGLSILSGAHNAIVPRVMDLLKQNKIDDVLVLVGGIIPDQDIDALKKLGVAAIFQPGTAMDDIVKFIRANVKGAGVTQVRASILNANYPITQLPIPLNAHSESNQHPATACGHNWSCALVLEYLSCIPLPVRATFCLDPSRRPGTGRLS